MRRRNLAAWIAATLLAVGIGLVSAGCGTPVYYSSSYDGYYGSARAWNDPWYRGGGCCWDYDRRYNRPGRPNRPPGMRPPGHRPPGIRPPGGGRPPGIPSRPRPRPRRR